MLGDRVRPGLPRLAGGAELPVERVLPRRLQAGRAEERSGGEEVPGRPEEVRRLHRRPRLRCLQRLHPRRPVHQGLRERGQEPRPARVWSTVCTRSGSTTRPVSACQPVDVSLEGRGHASKTVVRLVPPGEGRQVRAVPEERQAGHRHARRHARGIQQCDQRRCRSKHRRPYRPRPRPHPDHQPTTRGPHERNQHLRPRNARRAAHARVAQRGPLDPVPRGERHRRHPGADRGARVDERALQDRG